MDFSSSVSHKTCPLSFTKHHASRSHLALFIQTLSSSTLSVDATARARPPEHIHPYDGLFIRQPPSSMALLVQCSLCSSPLTCKNEQLTSSRKPSQHLQQQIPRESHAKIYSSHEKQVHCKKRERIWLGCLEGKLGLYKYSPGFASGTAVCEDKTCEVGEVVW